MYKLVNLGYIFTGEAQYQNRNVFTYNHRTFCAMKKYSYVLKVASPKIFRIGSLF